MNEDLPVGLDFKQLLQAFPERYWAILSKGHIVGWQNIITEDGVVVVWNDNGTLMIEFLSDDAGVRKIQQYSEYLKDRGF